MWARRYDDAIAQMHQTLGMVEPANVVLAHSALWAAFYRKRMYQEALAEAKKLYAAAGDREVAEALTRGWAEAGYPGAMRLAAEKLSARSKLADVSAIDIAVLCAHAGEKGRVLHWLEKAYEIRKKRFILA